jgi:DNA repair protein RadC
MFKDRKVELTTEKLIAKLRRAGFKSVDSAEAARFVLDRYHEGVGDLTGKTYDLLSELSTRGRRKPNPKKRARQEGKRRRKKRTGSTKG